LLEWSGFNAMHALSTEMMTKTASDRWTKTEMDLYLAEGLVDTEEYEHAVARGAKYIVKLVEVECLLIPST
jgi:3-oxoacyl-(acyl-carrier-protein) synthase